jgi:hypothetical protein
LYILPEEALFKYFLLAFLLMAQSFHPYLTLGEGIKLAAITLEKM